MNQEPNLNPPPPESQDESSPENAAPENAAPENADFSVEPLEIVSSENEVAASETRFAIVPPAEKAQPVADAAQSGFTSPTFDVTHSDESAAEVMDRDVWAAPPPPPPDVPMSDGPMTEALVPTVVHTPPPVAPRKEKSNLISRVITALIGIPIALWLVWHAGPTTFNLAVGILALLSLRELGGALRSGGFTLVRGLAYPALIVLLLSQPLMASGSRWGALLVWALPFLLVIALLCEAVLRYPQKTRLSLQSIALSLFATLYVGLFVFIILLRSLKWPEAGSLFEGLPPFGELPNFVPHIDRPQLGPSLLWLTLLAVWSGDTVAYFAGRKMGKEKLTPLSPGKTWEGAVAGLTATIAVCVPVAKLLEIEIGHGLALGVLIALAAPLGDLAESFWKRELNVKDVGGCLPGHGGILDRFDSLLFAVFAVYLYAQLVLLGR